MKISITTRWLFLVTLFMAPYVVMIFAGTLWLYDQGWLLAWVVGNAVVTFLVWYLLRQWRERRVTAPPAVGNVEPDPRWTPAGEAAWRDVTAIATRETSTDLALDDVQHLWEILHEILEVAARHFHPKAREPVLEIPVPYILRVVELVASDLRDAFSDHVPGAHILTLRDFQRMKHLADLSQRLYVLYRIVRFGMNPVAAVVGEAREAAGSRMASESTADLKRWAIGYAIQKAGFYAIQLYSGQVILSDVDFETFYSKRAKREEDHAEKRDATIAAEPLRVLVLGQVKAGKSSLINALFGETRAAVDVVPRTKNVDPYVLERDGLQRAIILDTAGFAVGTEHENPFVTYRQQVLNADLILVVCSAVSAARGSDRDLLNDLRTFFQQEPNRILPPILVALTHIDQLRPWQEWNPPYNLTTGTNAKSLNIAAAVEAVARDLQMPAEQIVPVCLAEGRVYNVDDGLIPAILHSMTAAQRVKYQRCLRQAYDDDYWRRIWQQAANSGRWLYKTIQAART